MIAQMKSHWEIEMKLLTIIMCLTLLGACDMPKPKPNNGIDDSANEITLDD